MLHEHVPHGDRIRSVNDFPIPGFVYTDITGLLHEPAAFRYAIDRLAEVTQPQAIDAVVALEPNGYLIGAPLAYLLGARLVIARTQGLLPGDVVESESYLRHGDERLQIPANALAPTMRVLVVEDMLASGRTLAAACELVTRTGASVVGIACLVEIVAQQGRTRLGSYTINAVLTV